MSACKAKTHAGATCGMATHAASGFCWRHDPALEAMRSRVGRRGARVRYGKKAPLHPKKRRQTKRRMARSADAGELVELAIALRKFVRSEMRAARLVVDE